MIFRQFLEFPTTVLCSSLAEAIANVINGFATNTGIYNSSASFGLFREKQAPCFWPFKSIILHPKMRKMRLLLHNLYNKWCLGSTVKKTTLQSNGKSFYLEIFVFSSSGQRYTYRVLQTIQMELILLCVQAEPAILGSTKTALKFKYEI